MVSFKVVIGTKAGKSVQRELQEPEANALIGKKLGDAIKGETIGHAGYEFIITGGSDNCGFPMRKDVEGPGRKRILAVQGTGLKKKGRGIRQRKTVCGNTINEKTAQINLKITTEGKEPLVKEEKTEEGAEAPKEEKKEEAKKE